MYIYHHVYVVYGVLNCNILGFFFFQAEDGIRDLVRSRGLGDVYKRQNLTYTNCPALNDSLFLSGSKPIVTTPSAGLLTLDLSLIHI